MRNKIDYNLGFFILFILIVLGAYLYFQPAWSLMNDHQFLHHTASVWENNNIFQATLTYINDDGIGEKMRPLFSIYVLASYTIFAQHPLFLQIFNFLALIALFPLWGIIYHKIFSTDEKISKDVLFIYPLMFFLFTPFWNNFMYINIQEKFIFFFSSLASYCFVQSYQKRNQKQAYIFIILTFLAILSKPTSIFLYVAVSAFAILDFTLFKKAKKISWTYLGSSLVAIPFYFVLVKMVIKPGGVSHRYIDNFSVLAMVNKILQSSFVIHGLILFGIGFLIYSIMIARKREGAYLWTFMPICLLSYLLVMAPYSFSNYFLAPLSPFIFGLFYPGYIFLKKVLEQSKLKLLPQSVILILVFLTLFQIIIPRISKIADVRKVAAEIAELKAKDSNSQFYFPPPFFESRDALKYFSGTDIRYLRGALLENRMIGGDHNYLIVRDACTNLQLRGVTLGSAVFDSNTFKIFEVLPSRNHNEKTNFSFPKTAIQELIHKLRRHEVD